MKLKPFNLDDYKSGKYIVVTRNRKVVAITSTDGTAGYPIEGVITEFKSELSDDDTRLECWTEKGKFFSDDVDGLEKEKRMYGNTLDLMLMPMPGKAEKIEYVPANGFRNTFVNYYMHVGTEDGQIITTGTSNNDLASALECKIKDDERQYTLCTVGMTDIPAVREMLIAQKYLVPKF